MNIFSDLPESSSPPSLSHSHNFYLVEKFTRDTIKKEAQRHASFTKKQIKANVEKSVRDSLQILGYNESDLPKLTKDLIEDEFNKLRFHSIGRNRENHKIYVFTDTGEYYSESSQKRVPISSMAKPHIANVLRKNYGSMTINRMLDEIGADQSIQLFKLLEGYFNADLKSKLKKYL